MIYVIYVQSGRENDVVSALRNKNITACSPTHDLLERKGGVWHTVRRLIVPSYVLVKTPRQQKRMWEISICVQSATRRPCVLTARA